MRLERGERFLNLRIFGYVTGSDDTAAKLGGVLGNSILETIAGESERQLCTLLVASLGNAICDGTVGDHAGDQDTFASKKAHEFVLKSQSVVIG